MKFAQVITVSANVLLLNRRIKQMYDVCADLERGTDVGNSSAVLMRRNGKI